MISSFNGEYRFLSNFHPAEIPWMGCLFTSVEAAYQASKCLHRLDFYDFESLPAGKARRRGHQVERLALFDELKLDIMRCLIKLKFSEYNEDLCSKLLETENAVLIEGNNWKDRFWGVCEGKGENHLGTLLMERRTELRLKKGQQ